jgi:hypothetical protein
MVGDDKFLRIKDECVVKVDSYDCPLLGLRPKISMEDHSILATYPVLTTMSESEFYVEFDKVLKKLRS